MALLLFSILILVFVISHDFFKSRFERDLYLLCLKLFSFHMQIHPCAVMSCLNPFKIETHQCFFFDKMTIPFLFSQRAPLHTCNSHLLLLIIFFSLLWYQEEKYFSHDIKMCCPQTHLPEVLRRCLSSGFFLFHNFDKFTFFLSYY